MTKFALLCNGISLIVLIGFVIYQYSVGKIPKEQDILIIMVIMAFLMSNIRALTKNNQYDGQPQGLLTNVSFVLNSLVIIIAIVFLMNSRTFDLGGSILLLVPLTTIIALKGEGAGRVLGFTSLYFKRRRLEEELRVRELEEKLNKKKEDDI